MHIWSQCLNCEQWLAFVQKLFKVALKISEIIKYELINLIWLLHRVVNESSKGFKYSLWYYTILTLKRKYAKTYNHKPVDAPSDNAFTTCPTVWMPPSAMTGTPNLRAYSATLYTAVPCGLPHAMTVKKLSKRREHRITHRLCCLNKLEKVYGL